MSDLVKRDARRLHNRILRSIKAVRGHLTTLPDELIQMHEEQGWAALGFASWDQYCLDALGMSRQWVNKIIKRQLEFPNPPEEEPKPSLKELEASGSGIQGNDQGGNTVSGVGSDDAGPEDGIPEGATEVEGSDEDKSDPVGDPESAPLEEPEVVPEPETSPIEAVPVLPGEATAPEPDPEPEPPKAADGPKMTDVPVRADLLAEVRKRFPHGPDERWSVDAALKVALEAQTRIEDLVEDAARFKRELAEAHSDLAKAQAAASPRAATAPPPPQPRAAPKPAAKPSEDGVFAWPVFPPARSKAEYSEQRDAMVAARPPTPRDLSGGALMRWLKAHKVPEIRLELPLDWSDDELWGGMCLAKTDHGSHCDYCENKGCCMRCDLEKRRKAVKR